MAIADGIAKVGSLGAGLSWTYKPSDDGNTEALITCAGSSDGGTSDIRIKLYDAVNNRESIVCYGDQTDGRLAKLRAYITDSIYIKIVNAGSVTRNYSISGVVTK